MCRYVYMKLRRAGLGSASSAAKGWAWLSPVGLAGPARPPNCIICNRTLVNMRKYSHI